MESLVSSHISAHVPTVQAKPSDLSNMVSFIYSYEKDLNTWGALHIEQKGECQHLLKKKQKPSYSIVKRQMVTEICHAKGVFSVHNLPALSALLSSKSLLTDESTFWKSLCQAFGEEEQLNISIYPSKSFYLKRGHSDGFNMHRIPHQSLLQIGGKKITNQFNSTLIQTHRAGAVFPLGTARQCLLSLHYLHQGSACHWYVIPGDERSSLEKILKEKGISICLDHQQLLLDPDFLDKHCIRYFRITQDSGQFVVLGAGTLAQSYCTGASWSETIDFALPSWLEYDRAQSHTASCVCNTNNLSMFPAIDVNLFRSELVDRYVTEILNCISNDNVLILTDSSSSSVHNELSSTIHNSSISSSAELSMSIPSGPDSPSQSSVQVILSPLVVYHSSYEFNRQATADLSIIEETGNAQDLIDRTHDRTSSDHSTNELWNHGDTIQSADFQESRTGVHHMDGESMSLDNLFDFIPMTSVSAQSAYTQTDEPVAADNTEWNQHDGSSTLNLPTECNEFVQSEKIERNKTKNSANHNRKILYVSNLKCVVTKDDLKRHFVGCIKVILKRHEMSSSLKYALIFHRTSAQAEKNQKRPIDHQLYGCDCRIEFFKNKCDISATYNIAVTHIPENVNENELRNLFADCDALKYCPARVIQKSRSTNTPVHKTRILWGYAFLYYSDSRRAAEIVQRNGQYFTHNQSLVVSFRAEKF